MSRELTWPVILSELVAGHDLDTASATWAMEQIMSGNAAGTQVGAFLAALAAKGETAREVRAASDTMLAHATPLPVPEGSLDIVGTGGDRAGTVNISTMSAIVAAGAGAVVVKHGNRAASSRSGTADCLEALGLNLSLTPDRVAQVARQAGITFAFAQAFHPSMRHVAGPRRQMGIPTIFNILGPLSNPARPAFSAVGVASARFAPVVAEVFASRGSDAVVFRGDDGLDELTISTTSALWWVTQGRVLPLVVDPAALGVELAGIESLRGGDPAHNAQVALDLLAGKAGPVRSAVLLNTGLALALRASEPGAVHDQASFGKAMRAGMAQAAESIDSGAAAAKLSQWRAATLA